MRSSASGLLLLLVAVLGLIGFLTGNLDRWLGYLFDPARPPLAGSAPSSSASPSSTGPIPVAGAPATLASALVTVGSTTTRQSA